MSEAIAHKSVEMNGNEPSLKKLKTEQVDANLESFVAWCNDVGIDIDYTKVALTGKETSHNYGMVAVADIEANERLATIPKSALLYPANCTISELIEQHEGELESDSNWSRLIVSLMYESNNPDSKWKTYLDLFPGYNQLDLPMFWSSFEFENFLNHTCVKDNVLKDFDNMKKEFETIIMPFLKENKEKFSEKCFDFEYYKKLAAFVMAYSFTDPTDDLHVEGPMMVPVGDILNHIAKNNAELRFSENGLDIFSNKAIKKGEEVYNTYGEHSNTDLLHMYGFVEKYPENTYDNVEIPTKCFIDAVRNLRMQPSVVLEEKLSAYQEIGLLNDDYSIVIGNDGILNQDELSHILEIYSMTPDEFQEFCDNDFEMSADEGDVDVNENELDNENLKKLPSDWKDLILEVCKAHLKTLESDTDVAKQSSEIIEKYGAKTKARHDKSIILKEGQKALIEKLLSYF